MDRLTLPPGMQRGHGDSGSHSMRDTGHSMPDQPGSRSMLQPMSPGQLPADHGMFGQVAPCLSSCPPLHYMSSLCFCLKVRERASKERQTERKSRERERERAREREIERSCERARECERERERARARARGRELVVDNVWHVFGHLSHI